MVKKSKSCKCKCSKSSKILKRDYVGMTHQQKVDLERSRMIAEQKRSADERELYRLHEAALQREQMRALKDLKDREDYQKELQKSYIRSVQGK